MTESQQVEKIGFEPRNRRGWPKTQQQLDFALLYVEEALPAIKAAMEVGYAEKTAKKTAHSLVKNMRPFIAYLQKRKNDVAEQRYDASTSRVLREMTALALANKATYLRKVIDSDDLPRWIGIPIDELSIDQQIAVESYNVEYVETKDGETVPDFQYKLYDKTHGVAMLGKHLGMFNEKIMLELSHKEAQSKLTKFSDLPTDQLLDIIDTLEDFKQMAKDAAAIDSTATEL